MGDQKFYEIDLKQGDLSIQLYSDDVYFISRQMDKWFRVLLDDSYVPIQIPATPALTPQPQSPPQPQTPPPAAPLPPPQPELAYERSGITPAPSEPPVERVSVTPQPEPVYETPAPQPITRPEVQDLPPISSVTPAPSAPAAASPVLDSGVQNDFEAVMDTLMKDLEKGDAPAPYQAAGKFATTDYGTKDDSASFLDFRDIHTLNELANRSKASTSEDFLIITAFFLTDFESTDRFSLKRVNSQLVKSGLTPVNHSVLESTITKGFLSLIPDLTGMADVSEYSLSEPGRQYAFSLFT